MMNDLVDCSAPLSEYIQICRMVGMGFVIMGFIGYFVKLIHIPINNIVSWLLVGEARRMVQRSFEGRLWQQWMDRNFMPCAVTDHLDTLPFVNTPAARRRSMIVAPSSRKLSNALAAAAATTIQRRHDLEGRLTLRVLFHSFRLCHATLGCACLFDIRVRVSAAPQSTTKARKILCRCDAVLEVR